MNVGVGVEFELWVGVGVVATLPQAIAVADAMVAYAKKVEEQVREDPSIVSRV